MTQMKLNWKNSFKEENSNRLFEIFSEKNRINIEPQIFAGNILFERNYDLELLKNTKQELVDSIEIAFHNKYNTDHQKIIRENVVKNLVLRILFAVIIFALFYNSVEIKITYSFMTIDNKLIAYFFGLISFLPLLWIKRSNRKAIEKVEKKTEKKENLIQKINTELRF